MKLVEYQELALRSIKPHDSKNMAICDWCLGLMGETAEVVECFTDALVNYNQGVLWSPDEQMNLAKEIGDVLWYSVALCAEMDLPFSDVDFSEFDKFATVENQSQISGLHECLRLPTMVGGIAEILKHTIMHKEVCDKAKLARFFPEIWRYLHLLSCAQGFTLSDVAELNIAKLAHRYKLTEGGSYNHEASANRHSEETKFTDTEVYKELAKRITGGKLG